ncbi:MAG: DUF1569 domain-containing protein [Pirellulales bacterium]
MSDVPQRAHSPGLRRPLVLDSAAALQAEIERIIAAQAAGRLRATGNWTPAQICEHLARLIEFSYDGFPFRVRWHIRAASYVAKWVAWKPFVRYVFRPGYRLQGTQRALIPAEDARFPAASARLSAAVERIARGEQMLQPSPFEGHISHEQWVFVHLRHAELHLSFLALDDRRLSDG